MESEEEEEEEGGGKGEGEGGINGIDGIFPEFSNGEGGSVPYFDGYAEESMDAGEGACLTLFGCFSVSFLLRDFFLSNDSGVEECGDTVEGTGELTGEVDVGEEMDGREFSCWAFFRLAALEDPIGGIGST